MVRSDTLAALDKADDLDEATKARNLTHQLKKKANKRKQKEKELRQKEQPTTKTPKNTFVSPEQTTKTMARFTAKEVKALEDKITAYEEAETTWEDTKKIYDEDEEAYRGTIAELQKDLIGLAVITKENDDFRKENDTLKKHLQAALKGLREAGKTTIYEQSKTVKSKIHDYIKGSGYREWKFIKSDDRKEAFVTKIYDNIAEKLGLTDEESDHHCSKKEFHRIYTGVCIKKLGDRRQLTQTMMLKAVISFYKKHKFVPTPEAIKKVWELPAKEDPSYKGKEALLLWYVDHLLPAMVGFDQFGPNIRRYKMLIDVVEIDNKRKPLVTIKSEGFGWVTYENCFSKWLEVVPEKVKDFEWKAPEYNKDDEDTHKWHLTKWSDSRSGQVPGGGWAPEAYTALNDNVAAILKIRKDDHANTDKKWKMMKFALKLIRDTHGITAKEHSNKRKRRKTPVAVLQYDDIVDDVDDDFSVTTAGSGSD